MCYAQQAQSFTQPMIAMIGGERYGNSAYGTLNPFGNAGLAGVAGPTYRTNRFDPELGGFVPQGTGDKFDPGEAPEGFYKNYRFGADGKVMGSLDGKTFAPIEGLSVDMNAIKTAYKPTEAKAAMPVTAGSLNNLANALYKSPESQSDFNTQFADGGDIIDFKTDASGNLFARVNSGKRDTGTPSHMDNLKAISGQSATGFQRPRAETYEGYIPITGYPLQDSGDGNIKEGRSAFFSPDGLVGFNDPAGSEYGGMLTAYSRRMMQALSQADGINLQSGQRAGG